MRYFLLIMLVGLLLCSGCVNDLKKVKELTEKGAGVEVAKDIETYYYGPNGNLKGILRAPVLYRYVNDTPRTEMNSGLKVDFYNDSLQIQSVLTAKKGEYFEKTNDITVSDSVVVTTIDGKKLLTDELHWDPKKEQFYTDKPARIITPAQDLTGKYGLVAPADLSWYKFFSTSGDLKMDSTYFSENARDTMRTDSAILPPSALMKKNPSPDSVLNRKDTTRQP